MKYDDWRNTLIKQCLNKQKNKVEYADIFEKWLIKIIGKIDLLNRQDTNITDTVYIDMFNEILKLVGSVLPREDIFYTFKSFSILLLDSNIKAQILDGLFAIKHLLDEEVNQFLTNIPLEKLKIRFIIDKYLDGDSIKDSSSIKVIIDTLKKDFKSDDDKNYYMGLIGRLIVMSDLVGETDIKNIIEEYAEKNDEFKFLLLPDKFDESKLDNQWLLLYSASDALLEYLKKNSKQKELIISAINRTDLEALNKEEINRLFYVYKFMTKK